MGILDEPVRGLVAPPWFNALSGLDRTRAWYGGLVPAPPIVRLLGVKIAHVGPGLAVYCMPAHDRMVGVNGQLEIWPLLGSALEGALMAAVGPGQVAKVLAASVNHFRPTRPGTGNLLARARVLNASSMFAYVEVMIEDSEGRQIAHGGGHAAIVALDPAPPPPPAPLEPIDAPTWATPDPWQRPAGASVPLSLWETTDGLDIITSMSTGALPVPLNTLLDAKLQDVSRGRATVTIPASEWFCVESRVLPVNIVATLANLAGWSCALTMHRAGETFAGLDVSVRFFREVPADGRPLRAEARTATEGDGVVLSSATVYDADGATVATMTASGVRIDNVRRKRPRRRPAERLLCTILFTDIVDSTARAEALGDTGWHALLERHHAAARQEIAFCQGLEVKSTGDGMLVRFSSPARALECATRLRRSLTALGIAIRAGLHTGECEVMDDDIVGMAVHLAARIQAAAEPGEVLVSSTVKDLAAGAGHQFEARGEHQLKGVEEPWRLWAVS
jgi:uncharacterized protein (TIGR00369 family)